MEPFNQEQDYFGLDLGNSSIKIAQLRELHGRPTLVTYGDIDVPENLIASDAQLDQEKVAEYVKQLATDANVTSRNVIAALPSNASYTAIIKTPKLGHKELDESIRYQADKYIPIPLAQAKIDWAIIGENEEKGELDILLVAAPNNIANKYLNIIQKAGFDLLTLEINSLAIARALTPPEDTTTTVMILDIGTVTTDIVILTGQVPKVVRTITLGSKSLRRVISQNMGVDETNADQLMKKFGLQHDKLEGEVFGTIKPLIDHLLDEVGKSVKFLKDSDPNSTVSKIILTGGTSALPGLGMYIANASQMTVEIGNPWSNISYPADLQQSLASISLNYATALGLALRNFVK